MNQHGQYAGFIIINEQNSIKFYSFLKLSYLSIFEFPSCDIKERPTYQQNKNIENLN